MSDEHPADMLARLGSDGLLWAQEFNKTAVRLGYSEMDEGWLIGWFANAIENSCNPLRNEVDALRAELAAERERNRWSTAEVATAQAYQANQRADKAEAERDELRALLREARVYVADMPIVGDALLARIDEALSKGGE